MSNRFHNATQIFLSSWSTLQKSSSSLNGCVKIHIGLRKRYIARTLYMESTQLYSTESNQQAKTQYLSTDYNFDVDGSYIVHTKFDISNTTTFEDISFQSQRVHLVIAPRRSDCERPVPIRATLFLPITWMSISGRNTFPIRLEKKLAWTSCSLPRDSETIWPKPTASKASHY